MGQILSPEPDLPVLAACDGRSLLGWSGAAGGRLRVRRRTRHRQGYPTIGRLLRYPAGAAGRAEPGGELVWGPRC